MPDGLCDKGFGNGVCQPAVWRENRLNVSVLMTPDSAIMAGGVIAG